jgi:ketosteroid isomerase-like protein
MSQQNVDFVASAIDRWNDGEWFMADVYDPELEWLPHRSVTEGTYRGIDGIRRFAEDTREHFDRFELDYELVDLGEQVLSWGMVRFRARQSGIESEIPFGGLVTLRDGKIVRWEDLGSKEAALEAAGLGG